MEGVPYPTGLLKLANQHRVDMANECPQAVAEAALNQFTKPDDMVVVVNAGCNIVGQYAQAFNRRWLAVGESRGAADMAEAGLNL